MSHQYTMPERLKPVVEGLGWGGILPFLLLPLITFLDASNHLQTLLITYGLLILAFLCGTLWMEQVAHTGTQIWRVVMSNLIVLATWPAVLLPLTPAASLLAAGFVAHLMIDAPWRERALPVWYGRLRIRLSTTVVTLLLITVVLGIVKGV